jgi:hypothetical protein
MSSGSTLADKAKSVLGECSRILVFDESGDVLFSTFQVGRLSTGFLLSDRTQEREPLQAMLSQECSTGLQKGVRNNKI